MQVMLSKTLEYNSTQPESLLLQDSPEQNSPSEQFLSSFILPNFGTGESQDNALPSL